MGALLAQSRHELLHCTCCFWGQSAHDCTGLKALTVWGKLGILRGVAADVIPRRLRADEDMLFNLNARITVNATQSDSMHFALVHPTERGPAGFAETPTPAGHGFILGEIVLTTHPRKRARRDLGIGRTGATERLSTARTMTASTAGEGRTDLVTDTTTKTAPAQAH